MKGKIKRILLFSMVFAAMLLSGCSNTGNIEQNTIVIKKDGAVLGAIIEDFGDSKYVSEELKAMLEEEIAAYNAQAGEDKVVLETYEITEDKKVKIYLEYASVADYAGFNEQTLFAGTVSEAYEAGYEFVDMENVTGEGASMGKSDVLEKGAMKMVIFQEPVHVRVNGKISYVSSGVTVEGKKEAATNDEEDIIDLFYLIYE
ncbi:MAG: hypothetical protein HDR22_09635 [Lachnospiraceae bacterium]|nr:hypothetical protein [Lachnospiraceae bacterium]